MLKHDISTLQHAFVDHLEYTQAKDKYSATDRDYYKSLAYTIRDRLFERWIETQQNYYAVDAKRIYYISMEYMMGRTLRNALVNLGIKEDMAKALWELGLDLEDLEQIEFDAGLGNGGLGRLAACFLDSMATLQLPAYGYGIRYEYGIFSQKIKNGYQVESPDHWLRYGYPWEIERPEYIYLIKYYGRTNTYTADSGRLKTEWVDTEELVALAYDTPVPGYGNNTVNNLRLWAAKSTRDFNLEYFNSGDYDRAVIEKISSEVISKVLYPRDDLIKGRELRLKQEYFLVSATLQDIIRRFKKSHKNDFSKLPESMTIQLNDTHPSLAIPELMRILLDEEDLHWEDAWNITIQSFGYTNHTVLPEALETWRVSLMQKVLPRHMEIIFEINHRFMQEINASYPGDIARKRRMSIIEESEEKRVRMANLSIVGSKSVNGVAQLHSEILQNDLFRDFYELWPQKFNNKTNGITQRRWLLNANPGLAELITGKIGNGWITDLNQLKKIEKLADDKNFRKKWADIKQSNKLWLAGCIQKKYGIEINVNSIFDCQVKRIHEYKRQLLNVLHVVTLYNRIKKSGEKTVPRTVIFSGKAAPAYYKAKLIIKLINSVAETVNNDPEIKDALKVVFLENYSVSVAERLIPAADLSEQISTAGMEASGTGNMKFALNGALTIGTLDGANIEIKEQVGDENIFIFGLNSEQVSLRRNTGYKSQKIYSENETLRETIDMIANGYFSKDEPDLFKSITNDLLNNDYYLLLADFQAYLVAQEQVEETFKDKDRWCKMSIINCANMGIFSSDRTIEEYNRDIWKSKPVPVELGILNK
ncbi:MAG: glycogen/starch/alpha-glucan phosphorylase [Calditrichae bacterium]|nr:glycogen/starch/alpha-glucan phosphorylase [Calditrichota bacterium]MCB9057566.1 glycogen/starch/alpha-glucan phosphorylase [Calditrichia bacterium]